MNLLPSAALALLKPFLIGDRAEGIGIGPVFATGRVENEDYLATAPPFCI